MDKLTSFINDIVIPFAFVSDKIIHFFTTQIVILLSLYLFYPVTGRNECACLQNIQQY